LAMVLMTHTDHQTQAGCPDWPAHMWLPEAVHHHHSLLPLVLGPKQVDQMSIHMDSTLKPASDTWKKYVKMTDPTLIGSSFIKWWRLAEPKLRKVTTGFSPWKSKFNSRLINVSFCGGKIGTRPVYSVSNFAFICQLSFHTFFILLSVIQGRNNMHICSIKGLSPTSLPE
jgi:hypothetical protein